MAPHDLYLSLLAFVSEILGTISGFGSSTFFVPFASLLEKFQLILILTAILHSFGNFSKILLFREHFNRKLFSEFAVPSILLTAVGAAFSDRLDPRQFNTFLGLLLVGVSIFNLFGRRLKHRLTFSGTLSLSGISGFLTGLLGTGGAIRGLALSTLQIEKSQFIILSSSVDLGGDLLRAIIYLEKGFMDWQQWYYIPLFAIAAVLGSFLGKKILRYVSQSSFEKIVAVSIGLTGILMLLK